MTSDLRIPRLEVTATSLHSVVLAVALVALILAAAPAHSEAIDLACTESVGSTNWNIRIKIDTERRTVQETWPRGTLNQDSETILDYAVDTISDQFIKYSRHKKIFEGEIDRVAGTVYMDWGNNNKFRFACRRATQKF